MKPIDRFVEALRQIVPQNRRLIDQTVEQYGDDPFPLMKLLVEKTLVSHRRLCQLWADCLGVAHVNPFNVELPFGEGAQLPADLARRARAVVLNTLGNTATVALVDPTNEKLIASLAKMLGKEVSPVFAHPDEIEGIIQLHFQDKDELQGSLEKVFDTLPTIEGGREIRSAADVEEILKGEAVVALFNSILLTAFRRRASDIHLEPGMDECQVRMRVDGDMCHILKLPKLVHESLIVRVKVLCDLDVSQRRMPQDGAFEIEFGGRRPAFRAATMPSLYGEKAVLRLLGSAGDRSMPRLGALGLSDSTRQSLRRAILRPNGIILVCGPTGSGKTTTLYSCLAELNRPDLNLVTIEDPVEFRLPGAVQHQVNNAAGLKFANILRGVLRQDPDVVLVGEIRDRETAVIAAEAAMTGHLVLTSLHTNDSLQAITRLIELGVEPHLVAPTVVGVLSQRLVRRICPSCKESYTATPDELAPYFSNPDAAPVTLYRGRGCFQCHETGFLGRVGVHEMLEISEGMRDLILQRASPAALKAEAEKIGFRVMRYDALKKALLGWTTLGEVERNTLPELSYDV